MHCPNSCSPHSTNNGLAILNSCFEAPMSEETQMVVAALYGKEASLWVFDHPEVIDRWKTVIQTGYQCLAVHPPNVVAAREIAARVEEAITRRVANRRRDNLWQRWGLGAMATVLVGTLALAWAVPKSLTIMQLPLWVAFLGATGGATSGLVAMRTPISILQSGKLAVFSAATRPFLGAITGAMVYLLFASGAISISVGTDPKVFHVFVALAGGYCERLLGQVAGQAVSLLGASTADLRDER